MPCRVNQKVCFIGGAGHSGSTLLGFILGSHPTGFYAGEAAKTRFLNDPHKRLAKRVCKLCGEHCPIWSQFQPDSELDLYEQIAHKTGRPLIIDSAKSVDWIRQQLAALETTSAQPFFLFLHRDGRAVINSRIRKYPQHSVEQLIQDWVQQIRLTDILFQELSCPKLKVSYEALSTDPATTVQHLCQFLEITYCPEMLNYAQYEHHVLGGNNGTQYLVVKQQLDSLKSPVAALSERNRSYYEHHTSAIALDLRWKQELLPDHERLFNELAGEVNQAFRWDA